MPALYVTDQGAVLTKESERIVVRKEGQKLIEVILSRLEKLLIFGAVQVSTQALCALLDARVPTAFCTATGRLRGVLTPVGGKNIRLRILQVKRLDDAEFRTKLARTVVAAKVRSQAAMLSRARRNHPSQPLQEGAQSIAALLTRVKSSTDIASLRGLEGAAAAAYFKAFPSALREDWAFPGRRRRPPPDPVNAMLSFGYAVLTNEAASLLAGHSLDPCIGFMHEVDYGRPSLALDIIEEFRVPAVDRVVLRVFNLGMVARDGFEQTGDGIILGDAVRRSFLAEYEKGMQEGGLRAAMRAQVEALGLSIVEGKPYVAARIVL